MNGNGSSSYFPLHEHFSMSANTFGCNFDCCVISSGPPKKKNRFILLFAIAVVLDVRVRGLLTHHCNSDENENHLSRQLAQLIVLIGVILNKLFRQCNALTAYGIKIIKPNVEYLNFCATIVRYQLMPFNTCEMWKMVFPFIVIADQLLLIRFIFANVCSFSPGRALIEDQS